MMQFEAAAVSDSCNQAETECTVWKPRKIKAGQADSVTTVGTLSVKCQACNRHDKGCMIPWETMGSFALFEPQNEC